MFRGGVGRGGSGLAGGVGEVCERQPDSLVDEVKLLRSMQAMGFSLSELREVLDGVRASDINCADGARLLADKRARVDEQISGPRDVLALIHIPRCR